MWKGVSYQRWQDGQEDGKSRRVGGKLCDHWHQQAGQQGDGPRRKTTHGLQLSADPHWQAWHLHTHRQIKSDQDFSPRSFLTLMRELAVHQHMYSYLTTSSQRIAASHQDHDLPRHQFLEVLPGDHGSHWVGLCIFLNQRKCQFISVYISVFIMVYADLMNIFLTKAKLFQSSDLCSYNWRKSRRRRKVAWQGWGRAGSPEVQRLWRLSCSLSWAGEHHRYKICKRRETKMCMSVCVRVYV